MKEYYKDVAFTVYPVSDMAVARRFYRETLEFKETVDWGESWVEYDIGNGTLAITNTFPHLKPGAPGAILAIEVSDIRKIDRVLKQKGIAWATGPFNSPACEGGSIRDPDGNEIILHMRKGLPETASHLSP